MRRLAGQVFGSCVAMNLVGQVCFVAGGVGTIGRGIARGLLRAGATVVVHSSSGSKLDGLQRALGDSGGASRLLGVRGSLTTPEAAAALQKDVQSLLGGALDHVVVHGGVRAWNARGAVECERLAPVAAHQSVLELTAAEFDATHGLADMTFNCAAEFLRGRLVDQPGASFTLVTGARGARGGVDPSHTALAALHAHALHGLAAALRADTRARAVRVTELRCALTTDRGAAERAREPRARPLSADIGEIVAGIAATAVRGDAAGDGLLEIPDAAALAQLRDEYECDEIAPQPLLWNWEKEQRAAA